MPAPTSSRAVLVCALLASSGCEVLANTHATEVAAVTGQASELGRPMEPRAGLTGEVDGRGAVDSPAPLAVYSPREVAQAGPAAVATGGCSCRGATPAVPEVEHGAGIAGLLLVTAATLLRRRFPRL